MSRGFYKLADAVMELRRDLGQRWSGDHLVLKQVERDYVAFLFIEQMEFDKTKSWIKDMLGTEATFDREMTVWDALYRTIRYDYLQGFTTADECTRYLRRLVTNYIFDSQEFNIQWGEATKDIRRD